MKFLDITDTIFNNINASDHIEFNHEKVIYCEDSISGLKSIIAIHDTSRGMAIGGCRYRDYDSYEDGLNDVLRLSRGMTEKNIAADIPFGGGKAIIFGDQPKSTQLLKSFADFLNHLDGAYYSAEDIGITLEDIKYVGTHSPFVFDNVDPGSYTAKGIFYSIQSAIKFYLQKDLGDSRVSIQGAGSVGMQLANLLAEAGCVVYIEDLDESKLKNIISKNIHPIKNSLTQECDLLAPCAVGGILDQHSIQSLGSKIIAGGANNQLLTADIDQKLFDKGIHYIPDVLINSGGVIGLTKDALNKTDAQIEEDLKLIGKRVLRSIETAKTNNVSVLSDLKTLLV